MNWDKIDLKACLELLKEINKNTLPNLNDGYSSITYCDDKEEVKISYRELLK
jgi:hypothetical protein